MKCLKWIFVLALIIVAAAFPKILVQSQPPPVIEVPYLEIPVTLDGAIVGDEWSDAVMLDLTFYFYSETKELLGIRTGRIYFKHDCVNLWICFQIEDKVENIDGSYIAIFYDVSGDMAISSGDDEKGMLHPNRTFDNAIIPPPDYYDEDVNLGGTNDTQGASEWYNKWLTYEFVHPLNSGDVLGSDIALNPGDSIPALFMVGDEEFGPENCSSTGYYTLMITPCPVGGELLMVNVLKVIGLYLLILVLVVIGTMGIRYKKNPLY